MGDGAEAMLDGSCCEQCGEWLDDVIMGGEAPGFPMLCAGCAPPAEAKPKPPRSAAYRARKKRYRLARQARKRAKARQG